MGRSGVIAGHMKDAKAWTAMVDAVQAFLLVRGAGDQIVMKKLSNHLYTGYVNNVNKFLNVLRIGEIGKAGKGDNFFISSVENVNNSVHDCESWMIRGIFVGE
jgi:hypothetical protein